MILTTFSGVILTHSNIVSTLRSILPLLEPNPDDVYIAYLPLAHVLEITGRFSLQMETKINN
jgi:long-chain acyl-CoA synthetase